MDHRGRMIDRDRQRGQSSKIGFTAGRKREQHTESYGFRVSLAAIVVPEATRKARCNAGVLARDNREPGNESGPLVTVVRSSQPIAQTRRLIVLRELLLCPTQSLPRSNASGGKKGREKRESTMGGKARRTGGKTGGSLEDPVALAGHSRQVEGTQGVPCKIRSSPGTLIARESWHSGSFE